MRPDKHMGLRVINVYNLYNHRMTLIQISSRTLFMRRAGLLRKRHGLVFRHGHDPPDVLMSLPMEDQSQETMKLFLPGQNHDRDLAKTANDERHDYDLSSCSVSVALDNDLKVA